MFSGGNAWEYKTPEATQLFLDKFLVSSEFTTLKAEYEFIKKYRKSWEAAPYPPTFVTVDTCVIQSGHVLLVTRGEQPGKGLLALPGGFVEQNEKLVDAAVRELKEETSIQLSDAQLYGSICDKEIFDHPNRSLRGRTITTCFLLKLRDGFALPKLKGQKGEVQKVKFYPIAEVQDKPWLWFEDHHAMFSTMLDRVKN
jgi:bifunctional NMN adenylyltransferase/nudix hydrolase